MIVSFSSFIRALNTSKNSALLLGAGISHGWGIPTGYQLATQFGAGHPDLLRKYGLFDDWLTARDRPGQEAYVEALVTAFRHSEVLQRAVLDWLMSQRAMLGYNPDAAATHPDDHLVFVLAWLKRVFRHLVTTNWDFILESYLDDIYWTSYLEPFSPVEYSLSDGTTYQIDYDSLFFMEELDRDVLTPAPRWDIIARDVDLPRQRQWNRPLWKIHGSPFFLACPECSGVNRWKRIEPVNIGDPCPEHPEHTLKPEIVFWDEQIDRASVRVWQSLRGRFRRSDMIVVCGFSGHGGDQYIRRVVENHPNVWLITPDPGAWDLGQVNHIDGKGADLAQALRDHYL